MVVWIFISYGRMGERLSDQNNDCLAAETGWLRDCVPAGSCCVSLRFGGFGDGLDIANLD